ncbi:HupE/UreJ family protein [Leucothrix pacifica]|uniref:Uncharacterized protein n=1 Tax=Leucothrix pacifica TaxID=1247513 RepID=A0A317CHC5_9GAMM|nr:HupE/UreJ family protein [Leucothrix pacifica]PWQ97807.1 hypothetical protein DKW60_09445 [Leucothrix pacifica]
MTKQMMARLTLVLCCLLPVVSFAAGTNFFIQGLSHPLMVPAHLIVTFSLGLLLGQQGWKHMGIVLPFFILVIGASLVMTRHYNPSWNSEAILLPLAAITGVLVILKLQLHWIITVVLAAAAAVVIGLDSAVPMIPGLQARKIYASLAGSGLTVFGLLLVISVIAWSLRNLLQGIVLRVLGAWATAGAVLVLTLLLANTTAA